MSIKLTPFILSDDIDVMSILVGWYLLSCLGLASWILMKTTYDRPTDLRTCFTETLSTVRDSSSVQRHVGTLGRVTHTHVSDSVK